MKAKKVVKRGRTGFRSASSLLEKHIRKTSESRGFTIPKLLVNWKDIIGNDIAKIAKPVKVSYGREGIGAGLVLLTNSANAPIVQAQSKEIIDRVNGVYGYNAISRVRITQTDPNELIEENLKDKKEHIEPSDIDKMKAKEEVNEVKDEILKTALQSLGANILAKSLNEEELK